MGTTGKRYTLDELGEIMRLHQKWLRQQEGGIRANLRGANLSDIRVILSPSKVPWFRYKMREESKIR